jgi:excisionase family DNA binding protein
VQPITAPVPEHWSVQEVAARLHVSESTIRRRLAEGAFPGAFRVGRKLIRIPAPDLEAYRRRQRYLGPAAEPVTRWDADDAHQAGGAA